MSDQPHVKRFGRAETNWSAGVIGVAYLAFAVAMIAQPQRFAATPSYHNLISIAPSQLWGALYLIVAALLLSWVVIRDRGGVMLAIIAHTAAVMLTLLWFAAFIVRYATDAKTTVVNVVSWGVFLTLLVRSATDAFDNEPEQ